MGFCKKLGFKNQCGKRWCELQPSDIYGYSMAVWYGILYGIITTIVVNNHDMGFPARHGGTPSSLDGFCWGKSHHSKGMVTRKPPNRLQSIVWIIFGTLFSGQFGKSLIQNYWNLMFYVGIMWYVFDYRNCWNVSYVLNSKSAGNCHRCHIFFSSQLWGHIRPRSARDISIASINGGTPSYHPYLMV